MFIRPGERPPLFALSLALLAASCVSLEPTEVSPPVEPPSHWAASATDGSVSVDWLASFQDDVLTALVIEAMQHNHELGSAVARLDAASAQARIAGADLAPQLGLGARGTRQKQLFIGFPIPTSDGGPAGATFNSFGVSLDLSWELDLWGKLRARRNAGASQLSAAIHDLQGARLSLAAQTAKAWFALTEARMQRDLQLTTTDNYERSVEVVDERYRAGLRSALDLRLGQAQLSESRAILEQRERQLDYAGRQLELLLGRYPAGELEALAPLPSVPAPVPAGLPSELLERRPDLLAAEERVRAAGMRVHAAKAALLPSISLTGSVGTVSDDIDDLIDPDFSVWNLAAGILQPVFQGGRIAAGADLSEANLREILEGYRSAVLRAFLEVESTLAGEGFLARREQQLEAASEQSHAAEVIATQQYEAGLVDVITLLDAQRRALLSESARIGARLQRLEARVDLHLALGGGFELPAPQLDDPEAREEIP